MRPSVAYMRQWTIHYLNQWWNIVKWAPRNKLDKFSFKKIHFKLSSGIWRSSCLGLNVIIHVRKPLVPIRQLKAECHSPVKIPSCQYKKPHGGGKTILWLSYLHNRIFFTGITISLYWTRAWESSRCQLCLRWWICTHHSDVIMSTMASQITSLTTVCWTVYSGADQRKHQSSASLVVVRGIHRWPVTSPNKGPVTRKMLPYDDATMQLVDFQKGMAWNAYQEGK